MQNDQYNIAVRAVIIFFRCAAFLMGCAIIFGDLFFWASGTVLVHLYSTLTLLALCLGSVYATSRKLRFVVLWVVTFHILATISAAFWNGQIYFALMVVFLDFTLILISRKNQKSMGSTRVRRHP
jgi:hypothetical protein